MIYLFKDNSGSAEVEWVNRDGQTSAIFVYPDVEAALACNNLPWHFRQEEPDDFTGLPGTCVAYARD